MTNKIDNNVFGTGGTNVLYVLNIFVLSYENWIGAFGEKSVWFWVLSSILISN